MIKNRTVRYLADLKDIRDLIAGSCRDETETYSEELESESVLVHLDQAIDIIEGLLK